MTNRIKRDVKVPGTELQKSSSCLRDLMASAAAIALITGHMSAASASADFT